MSRPALRPPERLQSWRVVVAGFAQKNKTRGAGQAPEGIGKFGNLFLAWSQENLLVLFGRHVYRKLRLARNDLVSLACILGPPQRSQVGKMEAAALAFIGC